MDILLPSYSVIMYLSCVVVFSLEQGGLPGWTTRTSSEWEAARTPNLSQRHPLCADRWALPWPGWVTHRSWHVPGFNLLVTGCVCEWKGKWILLSSVFHLRTEHKQISLKFTQTDAHTHTTKSIFICATSCQDMGHFPICSMGCSSPEHVRELPGRWETEIYFSCPLPYAVSVKQNQQGS